MIRNFTILCKLNSIIKSDLLLFHEAIASFSIGSSFCPCCGAKGCLFSHASYARDLITIEHGKVCYHSITIPRVICSSCGHTHAILPDVLIPYGSYSLRFILTVLRAFFLRKETIDSLCSRYQLSRSTLYSWRNLFFLHKRLWLGYLIDLSTSSLEFLDMLFTKLYLEDFFLKTTISFLQSVSKTANFHLP